jgi:hypothetical protein
MVLIVTSHRIRGDTYHACVGILAITVGLIVTIGGSSLARATVYHISVITQCVSGQILCLGTKRDNSSYCTNR